MKKHLIFDLYGTLMNNDGVQLSTNLQEFWSFGAKTWMKEDVPEENYFEEYCKEHGGDPELLKKEFKQFEQHTHFFPGMQELLKELKEKGNTLHILSNAGKSTCNILNKKNAVQELFSTVTCSSEMGMIKPDPKIFEEVLEMIGATPKEAVMIGDTISDDIEPALSLGMDAIHFEGRKESVADLRRVFVGKGLL